MTRRAITLLSILLIGCSIVGCERSTVVQPNATNQPDTLESVIIDCKQQCDKVNAAIERAGGQITQRYRNVNLIAATLPSQSLTVITAIVNKNAIIKDRMIKPPTPVERINIHLSNRARITPKKFNQSPVQAGTEFDEQRPQNYSFNNDLTGASTLHNQGFTGQDIIVAVIDSGTANNAEIVPVLADAVIGGELFVPPENEPSATSTANESHGTWVASMIAAHGDVSVSATSKLAAALDAYAPENIGPLINDVRLIPMTGTAPGAKIYALKTFPADGSGAPSSRIIAAMDRVLTLKNNFLAGQPSTPVSGDGSEDNPYVYDSLDIKVVNMSLGGPTLYATQDLEDQLTEQLLQTGIVVVVAAGNEGFGSMTIGSPGTGLGALTVGAANDATHERIFREVQSGPGEGIKFRPVDNLLMASFSSRGPTPDGRMGIDVVANGRASFVQSADGGLSLVSGTSLSAPTVAGAAALLFSTTPTATAIVIRQALIDTANNQLMGESATNIDQGHGFIDLPAAYAALSSAAANTNNTPPNETPPNKDTIELLASNLNNPLHDEDDEDDDDGGIESSDSETDDDGESDDDTTPLPSTLPTPGIPATPLPSPMPGIGGGNPNQTPAQLISNIIARFGLEIITPSAITNKTYSVNLLPGEVKQFFIESQADLHTLTVNITNVIPELSEAQQNPKFKDDLFVNIIDAPTSIDTEHYRDFISADTSIAIAHPQQGLIRVALMGDWTNIGRISADITFTPDIIELPPPTATGTINDGQLINYQFTIVPNTAEAEFSLSWITNWAFYPTHDIDMVLIDPNGESIFDGATLASPEIVTLQNPQSGTWTLVVDGFQMHSRQDDYELRSMNQDQQPINLTLVP